MVLSSCLANIFVRLDPGLSMGGALTCMSSKYTNQEAELITQLFCLLHVTALALLRSLISSDNFLPFPPSSGLSAYYFVHSIPDSDNIYVSDISWLQPPNFGRYLPW